MTSQAPAGQSGAEHADPLHAEFRVNEIFYSLQGEGSRMGLPCIFVRLHGCKLRCVWCDTVYAIDRREGGQVMTGAAIAAAVSQYPCRFVEFTGGEPLEQPAVFDLMRYYCSQGYSVAVETGGHVDIGPCDERVIRIVDMKCPDSRMMPLNRYENLKILRPHDEVKFVIASRRDYEWSRSLLREYRLDQHCAAVLMSPAFGQLDNRRLAEWILADHLPVRLQIQMHKYIWHPDTRGV